MHVVMWACVHGVGVWCVCTARVLEPWGRRAPRRKGQPHPSPLHP